MNDQPQTPEAGNGAETPSSAGHNVIGIDRADFNKWVARHAAAEAECEVANVNRRKIRKEMRAEGIKLIQFDAMRKLIELTRDEQAETLVHSRYYLEWLGSPLGHQITMDFDEGEDPFDGDAAAAEAKVAEAAEGAGFQAGLTGAGNNPHEENTPAGQGWMKGHHEGADQRRQALGMGGG